MIFFASASANQNDLVEKEVRAAGAQDVHVTSGGVEFSCDLISAYRFCMWTRVATRLLVMLHQAEDMESTDELYEHSLQMPWENWINPSKTFAITETVSDCRWIKNSHFASLRFKDAIVERIRAKFDGERPSVDRDNPDIVFHLHVNRDLVSWYVDFAGRSLPHRGYRKAQTKAVMSEYMAASLVLRSDWAKDTERIFLDPFCGSGTVCIEAALIASNTAPGLLKRDGFAFTKLPLHKEDLWQEVIDEAIAAQTEPNGKLFGWDIDPEAIEISQINAKAAGVDDMIEFKVRDFTKAEEANVPGQRGCIVTDPPYGVRLDDSPAALARLYSGIGQVISSYFRGWDISILCGDSELLGFVDMKPDRTNTFINGGIECQVAHYYVFNDEEREQFVQKAKQRREERLSTPLSPGAQMAANRLTKNLATIGKTMKAQGVSCYRLYDADMPEYSAAIDFYEEKWICLQEYAAPQSIDPEDSERRLNELILATERVTGIDLENIYVKRREVKRGTSQYVRRTQASASRFFLIHENGHLFTVNFADYLDTGIFLDHRPVRKLIETMSEAKRFLNLFCYTGTATVYAAAGGALSTVSIDANSTYLDWSMKNMELNSLKGMNHFFYKDDCIRYLHGSSDEFDLIFCDPPTFSNSKSRDSFDVQYDHTRLIRACMDHLSKDGTLIFSTNFTRFKLNPALEEDYDMEDISAQTIGDDFTRNPKIHYCWLIRHRKEVVVKKVKRVVLRKKPE